MAADAELEKLYGAVREAHLQPLWVDTGSYVPRQPTPRATAAHWPSGEVFPLLRQAGETVASEFADRRVLVCNNPGLPPFSGTTQTVYACVQLLLPGERAAAHRHSQSAFRLVLSGRGACTILNGHRVYMEPGDFIVTPPWTWHGHANESDQEVIWLDGLDNAIIRMFDATFFELPEAEGDGTGPAGAGTAQPTHWRYAWDTMRPLLDTAPLDPSHGRRIRYLDPATGSDPLSTMAAFLAYLPAGFAGERYRSSDSTVFVALQGSGRTELDGESFDWAENDVFTVPTWQAYRHVAAGEGAVLFSFSDRGAQERLGCWREQRNA